MKKVTKPKKLPKAEHESNVLEQAKASFQPKKKGSEIDEIFASKKRQRLEIEKKGENKKAAKVVAANVRPLVKKKGRSSKSRSFDEKSSARRTSGSRKKTADVLTIFREEELGVGKPDAGGVEANKLARVSVKISLMASSMLRLRAAAAAKVSPSLMLPAYKMYKLGEEKVVNINVEEEAGKVVGSSHGWLGLFKEERERSSVSLWNPMSGSRVKLPPIHTIPLPPNHYMSVEKFIVDDDECGRAIWIGPCSNFLALCCPGRCTEWTLFGSRICYDELVYSRQHKLLFCLESNMQVLEGWDISDPRKPRIEWRDNLWNLDGYYEDPMISRPGPGDHKLSHLVSGPGDHDYSLFLVTRHVVDKMDTHGSSIEDGWNSGIYPYKTVAFDVHRIWIQGAGEISYMERSLDGLVMFVGLNHSFAVFAADFPHLKPDSIYFTDHTYHDMFHNIYGGHDIGIFDYKNRTISSCYYPTLHQSLKGNQPPPFWFTPASKHN